MTRVAYTGAAVFDGQHLHTGAALVLQDGMVEAVYRADAVPPDAQVIALGGGTLMPGFVDLQVNGGGGVMFNDDTSVAGLRTIAAAHRSTGTTAFLPTLITDTPARSRAAIDAVAAAVADGVPGIAGLHLEGPHLSIARKGAHDPQLIRSMDDSDEAMLLEAARRLPKLKITVAPENVRPDQIRRLSAAGIVVSLGHTDCSYAQAMQAFEAGATCVTHLFNAMSQLGNREPGLVGAAFSSGTVSAGLIADNVHVHAASMRAALASKRGPGRIFLVTDAMATVGSDITSFVLNGRKVLRAQGRLTLENGTLAGADLDMPTAVQRLVEQTGTGFEIALRMATLDAAAVLHHPAGMGVFAEGQPATPVHLQDDGRVLVLDGRNDDAQDMQRAGMVQRA